MRKLTLKEWAALGEVIGTVAVVVSLLFLTYTIKQNTAALHGASENVLFERHAELNAHFMSDSTLAAILVERRKANPRLDETQTVRWEKYRNNMLDIWVLAYMRYQEGLLSERQWNAWDVYFTNLFRTGAEAITRPEWLALQTGFDRGFWNHVEAALFANPAPAIP